MLSLTQEQTALNNLWGCSVKLQKSRTKFYSSAIYEAVLPQVGCRNYLCRDTHLSPWSRPKKPSCQHPSPYFNLIFTSTCELVIWIPLPVFVLPLWSIRTSVQFLCPFGQCIFHRPRFSRILHIFYPIVKTRPRTFFLLRVEGKIIPLYYFANVCTNNKKRLFIKLFFQNSPFPFLYI